MNIKHVQNSKLLFLPAEASSQNLSLDPNQTGLNLLQNSWWFLGALGKIRTLWW